jgi:hypothetical protein
MSPSQTSTRWSDENIIDLIRKVRNDLIKDFLDERFLKDYLANKYSVKELSPVKVEFIKRELKEFLIAPIDKVHYEPILKQIRETNTASLFDEGNSELFYKEIDLIVKKYLFQ